MDSNKQTKGQMYIKLKKVFDLSLDFLSDGRSENVSDQVVNQTCFSTALENENG